MEYLTVELDCTDDKCGKCRWIQKDYKRCLLFKDYLNSVCKNNIIIDYLRLTECIEACKKHKDKVG